MDDLLWWFEHGPKIWQSIASLSREWQQFAFASAGVGVAVMLFASLLAKLRGPEGQAHLEQVVRENAQEVRKDVARLNSNLSDFKEATANHFGRIDARMESFENSLYEHDERGKELRKDVKEAINQRTKMV